MAIRGSGTFAEVIANRGFVACTALLLTFAAGFQFLAVCKQIQFVKEAVPLKKRLDLLDHKKLAPYELRRAVSLQPQMLDALGTKDYIQWVLEDTSIASGSAPERIVNLFVTYYTGKPDQVPHVPEECYMGGGYTEVGESTERVQIPGVGQEVGVRVLEFEESRLLGRGNRTVMYLFHTNGRFCPDRQCVRFALGTSRRAYFSKVELSFGHAEAIPTKEKAVEAGKRFLQVLIPVLLEDHWPDWEQGAKPGRSPTDVRPKASAPGEASSMKQ